MALKQVLSRMMGAAILLIALALMPSAAEAHPGHPHGAAPAATAAKPVKADAAVLASVDKARRATPDVMAMARRLADAPDQGSQAVPCIGGCCSGMSCSACSALALDEAEAPPPSRRTPRLVVADLDARPGREPDGLIRPPTSFA
jgi:hypothetical protein